MHRAFSVTALVLALTAPALVAPALAQDAEEPDPTDLVPRHFSARDFAALDRYDLYDVGLALKRGRTILLAECSASQSRAIFEASNARGAPATEMLTSTCG